MLINRTFSVQLNEIIAPNSDLINLEIACGKGSKFNVTYFTSLRCNVEADFQLRNNIVSSVSKRIYDCI